MSFVVYARQVIRMTAVIGAACTRCQTAFTRFKEGKRRPAQPGLFTLGSVSGANTAVSSTTLHDRLPPRLLPVLYFAVAHVALALAFAAIAFDPRGVSGFFYHAR